MSLMLTLVSASGLVDFVLKGAAVMLLAWAVAGLLGRASAARRHLVWCLGVASLLLLPAFSLALPAWQVTWLPQWTSEQTARVATGQAAISYKDTSEALNDRMQTSIVLPPSIAAVATEVPNSLSGAVVEMSAPSRGPLPWLAIGWAAGVLLSLVPMGVGLWQLAVLNRRSQLIDDPRWLAQLDRLTRQMGVRRGVQLRQSAAAIAPLTWGALRPVLLVPAEAHAWPDQRRQLVLLHELAHIRRWDWLTQLVAHVACAVHWFNPLVWLAARQMRIERERACDDMVLAAGARASDYAQELLALATRLSDSRLSTLVAVPMTRSGTLEDRVRGILDCRRSRAALTTPAVCLGAMLAGVAMAPLAMLRAAHPKLPQPADNQPAVKPATDNPVVSQPIQSDPTVKQDGDAGQPPDDKNADNPTDNNTDKPKIRGLTPPARLPAEKPAAKTVTVRGVVLDHAGKPMKGAAVFAVGPTGLNLSAGAAWSNIRDGGPDNEAQPVRTDEQGRFEVPTGEAKSLAVSHARFDAWPTAIPAKGDVTIRLPEPARVEIDMAIDGADKESVIFIQFLSHLNPDFAGVRLEREFKMDNPGKFSLAALPPGKYQLCRQVMNRLKEIGTGAMLERQFFELKAGETKSIRYVRDKGSKIRGKVTWPANTKLMGIVVSVRSEKAEPSPFDKHEWTTSYASQTAAEDGTFLTERIAPGKYLLVADAYTPIPEEDRFRTGVIGPSHRAEIKIEVGTDGELTVPDLVLKPGRFDE